MPSNLIPEKKTLMSLTVGILRKHIEEGAWGEFLPPECDLASRMQIGRNTLRKALEELTREGAIEPGRSGKRRRILLLTSAKQQKSAHHPVYFLTPNNPNSLPGLVLKQLDEARLLLQEAGLRLQLVTSKAYQLKQPEKLLSRLVREHPASAWILHCSTEAMQRDFMRRRIPCVILGVPHPGITIAAVTPDIEAAARHAAGRLIGKNHKRICLLRAEHGLAGSEEAQNGFMQAFGQHASEGAQPMISALPENVESACRVLDRLMRSANPPTAFVVEKAILIPTIMTYLAQLGSLIPQDVSVISLFEDPVLEYLVPAVAFYRTNTRLEIKKLVTTLQMILEQNVSPAPRKTLMPDFVPGKSIAPPAQH